MKLIIVRHAEAVELGLGDARTDFDRKLTERGHQQARALAALLHESQTVPEAVWSSPLMRTRQTADHIVQAVLPNQDMTIEDLLAPGQLAPRKLGKMLDPSQWKVVVLVGHQPDLGDYAGWLIGLHASHLKVSKGAAIGIDIDDPTDQGSGTLEMFITPKWYLRGMS